MFASFLIYLQEFTPNTVPSGQVLAPPPAIENTPRTTPPPPPQVAAVEQPPQQRFQFYDLPNAETVIPETPENPVINNTPKPSGQYILQVGLFRNSPEAEGLKKYLQSLNIPATVEEIVQPDTGKWHRVQVGPFSDLDKLNKIREKLKKNNFETILVEK
jgi:cell division protein FtsN